MIFAGGSCHNCWLSDGIDPEKFIATDGARMNADRKNDRCESVTHRWLTFLRVLDVRWNPRMAIRGLFGSRSWGAVTRWFAAGDKPYGIAEGGGEYQKTGEKDDRADEFEMAVGGRLAGDIAEEETESDE
jgi:hypothetical protein